MSKNGMQIRNNVLVRSLLFEKTASVLLGGLLGIKDIENSYTLGNQGGGLSFSQKIDLLIDIGALSKVEKNKFRLFMEIRNKFMHSIDANTYEKCFELMNKNPNQTILKMYPQLSGTTEEQIKQATKELGYDIIRLTNKIAKDIAIKEEENAYKKYKLVF
jgi:hypothetical protein